MNKGMSIIVPLTPTISHIFSIFYGLYIIIYYSVQLLKFHRNYKLKNTLH